MGLPMWRGGAGGFKVGKVSAVSWGVCEENEEVGEPWRGCIVPSGLCWRELGFAVGNPIKAKDLERGKDKAPSLI